MIGGGRVPSEALLITGVATGLITFLDGTIGFCAIISYF
jgi:hypothetical protein